MQFLSFTLPNLVNAPKNGTELVEPKEPEAKTPERQNFRKSKLQGKETKKFSGPVISMWFDHKINYSIYLQLIQQIQLTSDRC